MRPNNQLADTEEARRLAAWQAHRTIREAAASLGYPEARLQAWTRLRGLPKVSQRAALLRDGLSNKDLRYWDAYCTYTTDEEAAVALGTSWSGFWRWRRRQKLPGHSQWTEFYRAVHRAAEQGNPIARHFCRTNALAANFKRRGPKS